MAEFIDETKLRNANELLNIKPTSTNKLVFVYSAPKVGSTSIVSSLRIFGITKLDVIHIHDEEMLRVLANIRGVTVNEIIAYNKHLGRDVYVINVYRSPIERKISAFFEKIGCYHFNDEDERVNNYSVKKVIRRFNNLFLHIGNGDHFMDKYNVQLPETFDFTKKYLFVQENGINYISLRLKDSALWSIILSNIFQFQIRVVKDYESTNKPIRNIYQSFKSQYRIPVNLLDEIMNCKYLNYYYSSTELAEYRNEWFKKSGERVDCYSAEQYRLYEEITLENAHFDHVQTDHYIDEGCVCKACQIKRTEMAFNVMRGLPVKRLAHVEAKSELIEKRVTKIGQAIRNTTRANHRGKNFKLLKI